MKQPIPVFILKRYKCHKEVDAAQIQTIRGPFEDSIEGSKWQLVFEGGTIEVPHSWFNKHNPRPGGYFVQYADGYTSFSPAEAFEGGYVPIFGESAHIAPREKVSVADVESFIESEHYFTAAQADRAVLMEQAFAANGGHHLASSRAVPEDLQRLTFCVLVLKNGLLVTGESHCQRLEDFSAEVGWEEARKEAINKIWPVLISLKKAGCMNLYATSAKMT